MKEEREEKPKERKRRSAPKRKPSNGKSGMNAWFSGVTGERMCRRTRRAGDLPRSRCCNDGPGRRGKNRPEEGEIQRGIAKSEAQGKEGTGAADDHLLPFFPLRPFSSTAIIIAVSVQKLSGFPVGGLQEAAGRRWGRKKVAADFMPAYENSAFFGAEINPATTSAGFPDSLSTLSFHQRDITSS